VNDSQTGEVLDDRKHLSMMEDFWLPRREGGKGTEITTLPGGQNLGELEDVKYFEKKLYKSLNVPVSRLDPNQSGFSLGRVGEITRDEVKFSKFVDRQRLKFSEIFGQALRVQCVLKGICTDEEYNEFKEYIYFDFIKDNNFAELKEAELVRERLSLLGSVDPYVGRYYSMEWIQRNVLRLTDDDMKEMRKQIDAEKAAGLIMDPMQIAQQGQQELMNPDGGSTGGADAGAATPAPAPSPQPKGDLSLGETISPPLRMLGRAISNNNMSKQSLYETQANQNRTIVQESVVVEPEDPNVELTKSLINFIDSMSSEDNKVGTK